MLLENLKESRLAQSMSSDLPKDADLVERAVDIKAWYDGYHFGDFDVYCPWDVMNYLLELQRDPKATPISYWKIPVTMRSFALLYNHPLYSSGMKIYSAASEKNLEIFR